MADRKQTNKYYPPDFDPKKHKTINNYVGQHPFRDRARKLDQGILIIRWEMPFDVFCNECSHCLAKGTRFNAEKKCIGNFFSTKILQFSFRCPNCINTIYMETDPEHTDYIVRTGGSRRVLASDVLKAKLSDSSTASNLTSHDEFIANKITLNSKGKKNKDDLDALSKLELEENDKFNADSQVPELLQIHERSSLLYGTTHAKVNRFLREKNREEKLENQNIENQYKKKFGNSFHLKVAREKTIDDEIENENDKLSTQEVKMFVKDLKNTPEEIAQVENILLQKKLPITEEKEEEFVKNHEKFQNSVSKTKLLSKVKNSSIFDLSSSYKTKNQSSHDSLKRKNHEKHEKQEDEKEIERISKKKKRRIEV